MMNYLFLLYEKSYGKIVTFTKKAHFYHAAVTIGKYYYNRVGWVRPTLESGLRPTFRSGAVAVSSATTSTLMADASETLY